MLIIYVMFSVLTAVVKFGMWGLRKGCCKSESPVSFFCFTKYNLNELPTSWNLLILTPFISEACIALITTCIALAGVLIQQKLITVPKSVTPVWLVWNVWAVVMYAAVLVYARSVNLLNSFTPCKSGPLGTLMLINKALGWIDRLAIP